MQDFLKNIWRPAQERKEDAKAMKAQREAEMRRRITEDLIGLLEAARHGGATWPGSRRDLMEAAHIAYESGRMRQEDGHPRTFADIVDEACRAFNVTPPRNPRSCALRAMARKGVKRSSLVERYMYLEGKADRD